MVEDKIRSNNNTNTNTANENNPDNEDNEEISQELDALNNQLDQLHSALDMMEQKNTDIQTQLLSLLQSSKEIRQQINAMQSEPNTPMEQN